MLDHNDHNLKKKTMNKYSFNSTIRIETRRIKKMIIWLDKLNKLKNFKMIKHGLLVVFAKFVFYTKLLEVQLC